MAAEAAITSIFQEKYKKEIIPALMKQFGYKNPMMVPKITKITVSMGLGTDGADKRLLDAANKDLTLIVGQLPSVTKVHKSNASFKIRDGQNMGLKATLRKARMFHFLERLVYIALPRVKDFRGLPKNSFDRNFNYSFGIKEQLVFPEIQYDSVVKTRGMDISLTIKANTKDEAIALLKAFNLPIK